MTTVITGAEDRFGRHSRAARKEALRDRLRELQDEIHPHLAAARRALAEMVEASGLSRAEFARRLRMEFDSGQPWVEHVNRWLSDEGYFRVEDLVAAARVVGPAAGPILARLAETS